MDPGPANAGPFSLQPNPLMRLLGSTTRHYACPDCEARYFRLRRWMLRLSRGRA